jgi:hypothetical protein
MLIKATLLTQFIEYSRNSRQKRRELLIFCKQAKRYYGRKHVLLQGRLSIDHANIASWMTTENYLKYGRKQPLEAVCQYHGVFCEVH